MVAVVTMNGSFSSGSEDEISFSIIGLLNTYFMYLFKRQMHGVHLSGHVCGSMKNRFINKSSTALIYHT